MKAHREIVLTAGSIQSPQLLMLSGIGDGGHLATLGLAVRHDLPGVGRNLHDHLAAPVHMRMRNPVSYGVSLRAMPRNFWNVTEYLLFRRGPLANNVFESTAFVKSTTGLDKPDVQLVFQPAKRPGPSFPYPVGHGFAISPVGLYPRSRGRFRVPVHHWRQHQRGSGDDRREGLRPDPRAPAAAARDLRGFRFTDYQAVELAMTQTPSAAECIEIERACEGIVPARQIRLAAFFHP